MGKIVGMLVGVILSCVPGLAVAQAVAERSGPDGAQMLSWLLETVVVGALGIVVLIGAYYLWELITPYSVKDQLVKEKNLAVGIVVAAFIIGTAIVIAAALAPV